MPEGQVLSVRFSSSCTLRGVSAQLTSSCGTVDRQLLVESGRSANEFQAANICLVVSIGASISDRRKRSGGQVGSVYVRIEYHVDCAVRETGV